MKLKVGNRHVSFDGSGMHTQADAPMPATPAIPLPTPVSEPAPVQLPQRHDGTAPTRSNTLKLPSPMSAPDALEYEGQWVAKCLVIDNYSATGWLFVPSARRYIPPNTFGRIVSVPSSLNVHVVWQAPANIDTSPTDGDQATVTAWNIELMESLYGGSN